MCNTLIVNWPPSSFLFSLKTFFSSDDEEQKKFKKKGKVSSFIWEHFELDPNECWLSHCSLLWLWDFLLNDQSLYPRFCFVFFPWRIGWKSGDETHVVRFSFSHLRMSGLLILVLLILFFSRLFIDMSKTIDRRGTERSVGPHHGYRITNSQRSTNCLIKTQRKEIRI